MSGHCSNCRKIWTLSERQGVCKWCGRDATCQTTTTKPRQVKSTRRRKPRQTDNGGNGYDQLHDQLHDQHGWLSTDSGFEWATVHWTTFYEVASRYAHKAKTHDAQDLLHNIMEALAVAERNNGDKPFTPGTLHRIAQRCVADYWREHYRLNNGINCSLCSKAQRAKCRKRCQFGHVYLYEQCPRAITLESLSKPIIDGEGNMTELGELIADPDSLDREFWDRDSIWQIGYKPRLVEIAYKLHRGEALNESDRQYISRYRREAQRTLF